MTSESAIDVAWRQIEHYWPEEEREWAGAVFAIGCVAYAKARAEGQERADE